MSSNVKQKGSNVKGLPNIKSICSQKKRVKFSYNIWLKQTKKSMNNIEQAK